LASNSDDQNFPEPIVTNYLQACHAPTLVTLHNSLNFPESIAIKYRHSSQCYVRREQRNESLKVLVGFLDHGVLEILATVNRHTG
jgi:hypothetical protein